MRRAGEPKLCLLSSADVSLRQRQAACPVDTMPAANRHTGMLNSEHGVGIMQSSQSEPLCEQASQQGHTQLVAASHTRHLTQTLCAAAHPVKPLQAHVCGLQVQEGGRH
jgi:hypothetical protein